MERSPSGYLPRYPHFDQVFGKPSTLSKTIWPSRIIVCLALGTVAVLAGFL